MLIYQIISVNESYYSSSYTKLSSEKSSSASFSAFFTLRHLRLQKLCHKTGTFQPRNFYLKEEAEQNWNLCKVKLGVNNQQMPNLTFPAFRLYWIGNETKKLSQQYSRLTYRQSLFPVFRHSARDLQSPVKTLAEFAWSGKFCKPRTELPKMWNKLTITSLLLCCDNFFCFVSYSITKKYRKSLFWYLLVVHFQL